MDETAEENRKQALAEVKELLIQYEGLTGEAAESCFGILVARMEDGHYKIAFLTLPYGYVREPLG